MIIYEKTMNFSHALNVEYISRSIKEELVLDIDIDYLVLSWLHEGHIGKCISKYM